MRYIKPRLFSGLFIILTIIHISYCNAPALPFENKSAYDTIIYEIGMSEMEIPDEIGEQNRFESATLKHAKYKPVHMLYINRK